MTAAAFALALTAFLFITSSASAQASSIEGWINVVWDTQPSIDNPAGITAFVVSRDGHRTRLVGGPEKMKELSTLDRGFAHIDIDHVAIENEPSVTTARPLSIKVAASPLPPSAALTQVTQKPFITILCRFADDSSTPITPAEAETITGTTYPGVAHYYGEQSQDPGVMAGNHAIGWYNLPRPRSAYIRGDTTDFNLLATECTAAADADVNFPAWYGVNLQLNGELSNRPTAPYDPLSFGGSWTLNRDGQIRTYGMTWMGGSFKKNYMVYSHEMGHALGWPHSSGRYGNEYDSRWDVMSVGYLNFTQQYGWLSIHTIASHKDRVGWIPSSRKWIPQQGSSEVRVIARTALPPANGEMLMAEIPISPQSVYTVETRKVAGYDTPLPGEAVLLHRVDNGRAYVVDPDLNGNPNDEGAMWRPGETFIDSENAISISVESATSTGFSVRITRGGNSFTIIGDAERSTGIVGSPYADSIVAQGALGPPAWSIAAGALPPGLTLSASTGMISGTPSTSGRYNFTLLAVAGAASTTRDFVIQIAAPVTFSVGTTRRMGAVGSAYSDTVKASGGSGSFAFSVSAGTVPPGLILDSQNGVLSGIPATAGTFEFTITAVSTVGTRTLNASLSNSVQIFSALAILSDSVRPNAVMGAPYADTLKASGSNGSFTWRVSQGELPQGLSMDANGIISGTPLQSAQSRFTVTASNSISSSTQVIRVLVTKPSLPQEKVLEQIFGSGTLTPAELKFLDLLGNKNDRFDLGDVRAWLIDTGRIKANEQLPLNMLRGKSNPKRDSTSMKRDKQ
jgi:M6 family metalloprotease-like protein